MPTAHTTLATLDLAALRGAALDLDGRRRQLDRHADVEPLAEGFLFLPAVACSLSAAWALMIDSRRAIFLSYASEDEDAAACLCAGLRKAGLDIWFDRNELRGGDAWDASIRMKIRDCALFVPVISSNTEARGEGYFRLEWKLAVDRSHLMAEDEVFLVPVAIDSTSEANARVPDAFRSRQWIRLSGGLPTAEFIAHVKRVLSDERGASARHDATGLRRVTPRSRMFTSQLAIIAAGLIATVALLSHYLSGGRSASDASTPRAPGAQPATVMTAVPAANSVAVLPFANLSDDKANEYFSDGVAEELLTMLQKITGLQVAARSSAFSFKGSNATAQDIGRKLGVAHLVEGSVRKSGDTVRIAARLTRAANGEQLWSDAYTRDPKDVFAVQSEIAQTIIEQMRGHLGGTLDAGARDQIRAQVETAAKGGTRNAEAHQLFLQGLFFLHRYSIPSVATAEGFFNRAVAIDPKFALAWAGLARAGAQRGAYANTKRDFDEGWHVARRAAQRALQLEPDLPAAHLARMARQVSHDYDWKGAAESLRRARAAAPGDAEVIASAAQLAFVVGRSQEGIELAQRAASLDPLNPEVRAVLAFGLDAAGRPRESEAHFQRIVEISPAYPWGHAGVAYALLRQGQAEAAVREASREATEWSRWTVEAMALWSLGKRHESDTTLARLVVGYADIAAVQIAQVHAHRGDHDKAFEWLERALRQRDSGLSFTKADATLAKLGSDPRWPPFLAKVGLADHQLKPD